MLQVKELIKQKKNIFLAIMAIILVACTCYQLRLIGIAIDDNSEVAAITENATEMKEVFSEMQSTNEVIEVQNQVQDNEGKNDSFSIENTQNIENTIEIEETTEQNINNETELEKNKTDIIAKQENIENTVLTNNANKVENTIVSNNKNNVVKDEIISNKILNNQKEIISSKKITNEVDEEVVEEIGGEIAEESKEVIENIDEQIIEEINEEIIEDIEEENEITQIPLELTFENSEYRVRVAAIEENALKDIKEIKVTPITAEENAAEYNQISEKMRNKAIQEQIQTPIFMAYDISLIGIDGSEKEPDGSVNVSFEYLVIPQKVSEIIDAEVSVVHLEENAINGDITLHEFSQNSQTLNVTTNGINQVNKLEFNTNSFSKFVISWKPANNRTAKINIYYVDENGNEIDSVQTDDINLTTTSSTVVFENYANDITNYNYKGAYLDSFTGSEVKSVIFSKSSSLFSSTYNVTFKNGNTTVKTANLGSSTATYNVYLVYEQNGGKASSTITRGSGISLNISDITGANYEDLIGFTWISNNENVVSVKTDSETGIPTITGLGAGKTTVVGNRADGAKIIWTVTVENGTNNRIVFIHRTQDNDDFNSKGDSYRPYSEYGYSSTEPTNIVQFVVVRADKDGHLVMNNSKPDVNLPSGSVVPSEYDFDLGTDGVFKITENTFGGISVPGYSYAGAYAYFGWYSNSDTKDMAVVDTFKNFGRVSTNYSNYYSVLGFTTSRGTGSDYSTSTFGASATGYYAYNPTGVLMLVLQPVDDNISYKTNYHNDYNPKGLAKTNVIDTTSAHMVKGDWIANEYTYKYHGETIMTTLTDADLIPPSSEYKFVGWFDNMDQEGNGVGNQVIGSMQEIDGVQYYFALTQKDNNKIEIVANNDIYARWVPKTSQFTITKTISGGLNSEEINTLKSNLQFDILNESLENVKTVSASDMTWDGNTGIYTVEGIPVTEFYTIVERNSEVVGHILDSKIIYPNNEEGVKPSMSENANVSIENKYTTNIIVRKVDQKSENIKNVEFTLSDGKSNNVILTDDSGLANFSNLNCGETYILIETNTPNDYYSLNKSIQISVSENGEITLDNESELDGFVKINNSGEIEILNIKHVSMPKAGGIGTYWFYSCGILIMGITSYIYRTKNYTQGGKK